MNQERRKNRHHRLRSRVNGTATRPRVSVFRSSRQMTVQFIDDVAQTTLLSVSLARTPSHQSKVAQAEALGLKAADAAKQAGVAAIVFDRGGYAYHGRVKALADSLRAGGLEF